jgi:hypothetical protein
MRPITCQNRWCAIANMPTAFPSEAGGNNRWPLLPPVMRPAPAERENLTPSSTELCPSMGKSSANCQ